MKKYLEYIILGAVAIVCILYIGFRESSEINYTLPSLRTISRDDFSKFEIQKEGEDSIVIEKQAGGWVLTSSNFPADESTVNRILEMAEDVVTVDLVSQSGNHSRYDLDEGTRITLKGWNQDKLIRELYFGKLSHSENYNYILIPGDKNVYTLRGNMTKTLELPEEEFRSRTVLQLNRNDIIRITYSDSSFTKIISKTADDSWTDEAGLPWSSQTVNEILGNISSLSCTSFLESPPAGVPVTFTLSGITDHSLTLFPETEEGFPGVSSFHPYPFIITSYTGNALISAFIGVEEN